MAFHAQLFGHGGDGCVATLVTSIAVAMEQQVDADALFPAWFCHLVHQWMWTDGETGRSDSWHSGFGSSNAAGGWEATGFFYADLTGSALTILPSRRMASSISSRRTAVLGFQ
jgi:hypothetical protein